MMLPSKARLFRRAAGAPVLAAGFEAPAQQDPGAAAGPHGESYDPPALVDLGHVREVVLGSSSSGTADANSHYYW